MVEQRGFAHIGAANNGDCSTSKRLFHLGFSIV
jgi:hypothetical protein